MKLYEIEYSLRYHLIFRGDRLQRIKLQTYFRDRGIEQSSSALIFAEDRSKVKSVLLEHFGITSGTLRNCGVTLYFHVRKVIFELPTNKCFMQEDQQ